MAFLSEKLISASGGVQEETDDDFNLVTGLYHFDGSNGAQNNTLLDSSPESHTVTRNADIMQGTFSPFSAEEGKWSVQFDGSNAQNRLAIASTSDFAFGTGDYTLEAWVFPKSLANSASQGNYIVDFRSSGNDSYGTGGLYMYIGVNGSGDGVLVPYSGNAVTGITLNEWNHVAVARESGTERTFINGVLKGSNSNTSNHSSNAIASIGCRYAQTLGTSHWATLDGFLSNLRVVKGTAVYTSAFTPSTSPLTAVTNTKLLTCCSNRFKDKSTSAHRVAPNASGVNHMTSTILPKVQPFSPFAPSSSYSAATKGGSGFFDQTSDCYFDVSDATDFDFGTGDYTVEMWVYPTTTFIVNWAMAFNTIGVNQYWAWTDGGGNEAAAGLSSYPSGNYSGSYDHMPNRFSWSHIVFQNTSGTENWYINGVRVYNATNNPSFSASATGVRVGLSPAYASQFFYGGYISDVRVLKGSNAYSNASTLTVPTAPLGSVTNTKLLTNFTNAAMFDQSGKTNVETVGNAQLDTTVKKFGTASAEFDGSGDILTMPQSTFIPFASEDWTVECFVRMNSVSGGYQCIFHASNGLQFMVYQDQLFLNINDTDDSSGYLIQAWGTDGQIAAADTWYHVAAYRVGSAFYTSVNGFVSSMGSSSGVIANPVQFPCEISWVYYPFDGYIDEFRITRKARYGSSNFTAPTKKFPNL